MKDYLNEWNKEINYLPSKKKKLGWKDKSYRVVWDTGLELKSLRFFHSPRMTLQDAQNYMKNKYKDVWREKDFWIETKERGKWEKFDN